MFYLMQNDTHQSDLLVQALLFHSRQFLMHVFYNFHHLINCLFQQLTFYYLNLFLLLKQQIFHAVKTSEIKGWKIWKHKKRNWTFRGNCWATTTLEQREKPRHSTKQTASGRQDERRARCSWQRTWNIVFFTWAWARKRSGCADVLRFVQGL